MEKNKFQAGGSFAVYQALPMSAPQEGVAQAPSAGQAGASRGGVAEEAPTIPEAIIKDMLGKGLTNDVIAFKQEVDKAYNYYNQLSDFEKNSQLGAHLRTIMKGDFAKLSTLQRAKANYDTGLANIKDSGANSDYAITNNGVVVKNLRNNQIAEVSHADFAENYRGHPEFKMLTNAELLQERENNPYLVGDTQSLAVMNNAIGIEKVRGKVREVLANLGSDSRASSHGMMFMGNAANVINGAKQFLSDQEGSVNDFLKAEQVYKSTNSQSQKTNINQLKLAAETMWVNLDDNAKSLLRARAVARGAKGNQIEKVAREDAISLLSPAISRDSSVGSDVSYDSSMSKDMHEGDKAKKDALTGAGYWAQANADWGDASTIEYTVGDTNDRKITMFGNSFGAIQQHGKTTGPSMVRELTDLMSQVNPESITIGGQTLNGAQVDALRYEGKSLHRVLIPVTRNSRGTIVPESEARINEFGKLQEDMSREMAKNPRMTAVAKERLIRSHGFNPMKTANGDVVPQIETGAFYAMDATINAKALPSDSRRHLDKVDDQTAARYYSNYEFGSNTAKNEKKSKVAGATDLDARLFSPSTWFSNPDVYKGVVYMKIANENGHVAGNNLDGNAPLVNKQDMTLDNLTGAPMRAQQEMMKQRMNPTPYSIK